MISDAQISFCRQIIDAMTANPFYENIFDKKRYDRIMNNHPFWNFKIGCREKAQSYELENSKLENGDSL